MSSPQTVAENFVKELTLAAEGQATSLPFIRHTLVDNPIVQDGETFQAIVAGGSCFQKATLKKTGGDFEILSQDEGDQPVFATKEILFTFLASHLDPNVSVVGLNFAYPMTPVVRGDILDGTLSRGTKENDFTGLVGQVVGEEFEKYIKQTTGRDIKVACANDTICLLLSGLLRHKPTQLAAGIVGTGMNFAIFLDEHTAINLESSNFDKFERSEPGIAVDNASNQPGTSFYEKETAGAYIYQQLNHLIKERNLPIPPLESTKLIDAYAQDDNPEIAAAAQEVLQRSAGLIAAQIAGLMTFLDRDLTFIMQGSVYWKGYRYKETISKLVEELCPQHTATFEKDTLSDIYGAAKLVA